MTDDTDLKQSAVEREPTSDRTERTDRSSERAEHELSGGRRDRSRELLRNELTKNLDESNRRTGGKPRESEPDGRPARQAKEATSGTADGEQQAPGIGHNSGDATPLDISKPPARWKKEAKQHWANLPPEVQTEFARGEADVERGVAPLKQKIAQYADEDRAWLPHEGALRAHGVSRAQAVSNMLGWHNYLHRDPVNGLTDLVKTLPPDKQRVLLEHAQRMQQQGGAQAQTTNGGTFDPRVIQQYVDQRVGALEQQHMEQQQARTNEILENWARDKPHYSKVRLMMSRLLMPNPATGESIIPLKNGAVDLDSAYAESLKLVPEVWAAVQAEERAAERKRNNDEAARKRYTSSSLTPRAPGGNNNIGGAKKRGSQSVRDSISAAVDELSGR